MTHTSRSTAPNDTPGAPPPADVEAAIDAAKERLQNAEPKPKRRTKSGPQQLTIDDVLTADDR